jgi:hypothetical protein
MAVNGRVELDSKKYPSFLDTLQVGDINYRLHTGVVPSGLTFNWELMLEDDEHKIVINMGLLSVSEDPKGERAKTAHNFILDRIKNISIDELKEAFDIFMAGFHSART